MVDEKRPCLVGRAQVAKGPSGSSLAHYKQW